MKRLARNCFAQCSTVCLCRVFFADCSCFITTLLCFLHLVIVLFNSSSSQTVLVSTCNTYFLTVIFTWCLREIWQQYCMVLLVLTALAMSHRKLCELIFKTAVFFVHICRVTASLLWVGIMWAPSLKLTGHPGEDEWESFSALLSH